MEKKFIQLKEESPVSKYKQIVNSVLESISIGQLSVGEKMPSINNICNDWGLSRDTVLSAYAELKARGIIISMPGKGYYVQTADVNLTHKIFVLFDELNSFKEVLYNSFLKELGDNAMVEIYFHHFNRKVFENLITANIGAFTTYVIMPAKFTDTAQILESIRGRVIVLDQMPEDLKHKYAAVFQNFEKDTYESLMLGRKLLTKYKKLIMVYPGGKEPEGQFRGFLKYCHETDTPFELLSDLNNRTISKGEAYIAIWDRDLVKLVKMAKQENLSIGEDIGIVSYNDKPLKEIAANGITTISTDFKKMGVQLARLVLSKNNVQIENPSSLLIRESL